MPMYGSSQIESSVLEGESIYMHRDRRHDACPREGLSVDEKQNMLMEQLSIQ